jgi:hypothetical protein
MGAARAKLVKTKYIPRRSGGVMSSKRLLGLIVPVLLVASFAKAQVNELAVTVGKSFVSTQSYVDPNGVSQRIHFGNEETVAFDYARLLKSWKIFGFHAELPVAIYPRMDLNTQINIIPKDIGALFVTPSIRMNIFSGDSVTPWVSVGGGYGRFREAPKLNFFGDNPGPTGTNTGVMQLGAGLDVWIWHQWGIRAEGRDFYSGVPALNVTTNRSRQHNFYVGFGVTHRF